MQYSNCLEILLVTTNTYYLAITYAIVTISWSNDIINVPNTTENTPVAI